jgi:25S rRNA (uracil2843-N3)-methyltransferase
VLTALGHSVVTAPVLSTYASTAARAANAALVEREEQFRVAFTCADVLELAEGELAALVEGKDVVTVLFTLNELYAADLARTTRLMLRLGGCLKRGARLVVVDSPGDYAVVTLGGGKKYPMYWFLDHTLLEQATSPEGEACWEKVEEDKARWFRMPVGLRYPIELENMRYQTHVYHRI